MGWATNDAERVEVCKVLAAQSRMAIWKLKAEIEKIQHEEKRVVMLESVKAGYTCLETATIEIEKSYDLMYEVTRQLER
jgi:hypothetical protein